MDRFRVESTRLAPVDVAARLAADVALLHARRRLGSALDLLDEHRGAPTTPALGVVVVNGRGLVARVVEGDRPAAIVVGRHEGCDLFLPHADASLRHLIAVVDDTGCVVVDPGSLLGTDGETSARRGQAVVVRSADSLVVVIAIAANQMFTDASLPSPAALTSLTRLTPSAPTTKASSSCSSMMMRVSLSSRVSLSTLSMRPSLLIGRSDRCDVVVDGERISRVHAALIAVQHEGRRQALLVDAGTTNGTAVLQARAGRVRERELGPARRALLVGDGDLVVLAEDVRLRLVDDVDGVGDHRADVYAAGGGDE